ncbi:MAG: Uma2 family endonuclease [Myxococcota bacterium]|jgi:Uma2 family endonuclease
MTMSPPTHAWTFDPEDPRAPSQAVWDAMSDEEQQFVIQSLPSEVPPGFMGMMPEGDRHGRPIALITDALKRHFGNRGREAYIGSDFMVYYPSEQCFAPDVLVVLEAGAHQRDSWNVSKEGKGLDLVIEVLVGGNRRKDLERNVDRYARLGIVEYFVFEPVAARLHAFRLPEDGGVYERVVPQHGRYPCQLLGFDLTVVDNHLRFVSDDLTLPTTWEVAERLNSAVDELGRKVDQEIARAEAESKRADAADERADAATLRTADLERQLAEMRKQLEEARKTP